MQYTLRITVKLILAALMILQLCACGSMSNVFNPFYEPPGEIAMQGEPNDSALRGDVDKDNTAREALESMASYQRALAPQPVNPVVNPAVVRLMWVPDHTNRNGDLVPAHYYYLKVLSDRWAVSDAFEMEGQLKGPGGAADTTNLPYVYETEVRGK